MNNSSIVGSTISLIPNILSGVFTRLVVAAIIILIGIVLGRVSGKLLQKALHEIELNNLLNKSIGIKISIEEILSVFVSYFIYFLFIIMALNQLGITTVVLHMISGAVIVIVIISVLLGIKDFIPSVFASLFIHRKRFIKEGDKIKVESTEGKVIKMSLVETKIETEKGDIIFIPNSLLIKKVVIVKADSKKS